MIRTQESLDELLSCEYAAYVDHAIGSHNPHMLWTILGDLRYNLLWIIMRDDTNELFIECIMPTVSPLNVDGIHMDDAQLVQEHSDYMFDKYKNK